MVHWLGAETVELTSPIAEAECLQRLGDAVDREGALFGNRPIIGWVGEHAFRLRCRSRVRNPVQAFLEGETAPNGPATTIRCRVGLQRVAFFCWSIGCLVVFGILVEKLLEAAEDPAQLRTAASVAFIFALMVFGLAISRSVARRDEALLLDSVQQLLAAKQVRRQQAVD